MNKIIFILFITSMLTSCEKFEFLDTIYKKPDTSEWVLYWEENFDGLDETIWSKCTRAPYDWANYMTEQDTCYAIENGHLVLRGIENTFNPADTAVYLTGGVWTKNKMSFSKGRIEIKAKFSSNQGAWPALWLLRDIVGSGASRYAEIDIMEHLNYNDIIYQTVHTTHTNTNPGGNAFMTKFNPIMSNIFGVEIHDDKIVFLLNGAETGVYYLNATNWNKETTFYLILSMQLGGQWVGTVDKNYLPSAMYIDWIRYYKHK